MTAVKGRGYVEGKREKDSTDAINVLPIDSIFTPVKKVNFQVEKQELVKIQIMIN